MNLAVVCLGRLREAFFRQAADEYIQRLTRFGTIEEIELPDLPEPANASPALEAEVVRREGERILKTLKPTDTVIALCIEGTQYRSPDFAQHLASLEGRARGRIVLVIGGSLGLSPAVLARADDRLSLSKMTFPHQLARVLLLEQLYRAQKILTGQKYHK